MSQQEQFEAWATEGGRLKYEPTLSEQICGYNDEKVESAYAGWKAGQAALLPYMQVLLQDIKTIIALGLFTESDNLKAAREFIEATVNEIES